MKVLVFCLCGAVAGAGFTGFAYHRHQKSLVENHEIQAAEWQAEMEALRHQLERARSRPPKVETVTVEKTREVLVRQTPEAVIEELIALGTRPGDRTQSLREVVHQLENLFEAGQSAVPAIEEFMTRNQDVEFSEPGSGNGGFPGGRGFRRGPVRTDFLVPPSLRLGLIQVLSRIGGSEAEKVLADVLATTGRGIEVSFATRALESLNPGEYRQAAIRAATELLVNPIAIDQPSRLDADSEDYLYEVFDIYHDTSFAQHAQYLMVDENGRIDRNALQYLTDSMREQSMNAIYNAYMDPRLTEDRDRFQLINAAMQFTGSNPQADAMFQDIVLNESTPERMRAMMFPSLVGGGFGRDREAPSDPRVIQSRLDLLAQVRPQIEDDTMLRSLEFAERNLNHLLNDEPVEDRRTLWRELGRGRGPRP